MYLEFLNGRLGKHIFQFINNSVVSGIINGFILLLILVTCFSDPAFSIVFIIVFGILAFILNGFLVLIGAYDRLINSFKLLKILTNKIKGTRKKIQRIKNAGKKVKSQVKNNNEPKRDYYKETIFGYINSLYNAIRKIDGKESYGIYVELKDILDEYENKMIELNKTGGKGLSFDNSKQAIMQHSLNRLQELELQVAEIVNRDSKNKEITDESTIIREKLVEQINLTSQGQVEEKAKVRTYAKGN